MKKSELRKIIREEIQNLSDLKKIMSKLYTTDKKTFASISTEFKKGNIKTKSDLTSWIEKNTNQPYKLT